MNDDGKFAPKNLPFFVAVWFRLLCASHLEKVNTCSGFFYRRFLSDDFFLFMLIILKLGQISVTRNIHAVCSPGLSRICPNIYD